MKPRRRIRSGAVLVVAGLLLAVAPVAVRAQTDGGGGGTDLLSYALEAESSGIAGWFGDPTSEPYPVAGAIVPQSLSSVDTGPRGYALSSAAWPGPLVGNAGTLANLLLPVCDPQGEVCAPKPPPEAVSAANYPVRAEASAGGGRDEAKLGPLHALVDGASSEATATAVDFTSPGIVTAGRAETETHAFRDEDGRGVSVAETVLSDLELADGTVTIEAVRTLARVATDGARTETEHDVQVAGLRIGDQPATVDADGVHFGEESNENPLHQAVDPVNEEILSNFGMEVFLTRPVEDVTDGGEGRVRSGSLVVLWEPPDSGQRFIVSLGGSAANVRAIPGFDSGGGFEPGEFFNPPSGFGGTDGGGSSFEPTVSGSGSTTGGSVSSPSPSPPSAPVAGPTEGADAGTQGGSTVGLESLRTTSFPKGVPAGWAVIWLLAAAMIGGGLHQLRAGVLDPDRLAAAGDCDL